MEYTTNALFGHQRDHGGKFDSLSGRILFCCIYFNMLFIPYSVYLISCKFDFYERNDSLFLLI